MALSDRTYFTLLLAVAVLAGFTAGYTTAPAAGSGTQKTVVKQVVAPNTSTNTSNQFTASQIFSLVEPSVVSINVIRENGSVVPGAAQGSGIVYDTDGHIVTNAHVVKDADTIRVTFLNGNTYDARLVGRDIHTDLAVIDVDAPAADLQPVTIGSSRTVSVGQSVLAVGNPFGLSGTMTAGVVSQLGRLLSTSGGFSMPNVLQTDAAINPGNSGGPLLNYQGQVVGINTAIESRTGIFSGVGFAIPAETVKRVAPSLIETGTYKHSWIGVSGRDVSPEMADAMNLDEARGFMVVDVVENSPAEEAGLHGSDDTATIRGQEVPVGGDVIWGIDGEPVRKIQDILTYLARNTRPGDTITVTVSRDGEKQTISLTLAARPPRAPS
jgi:S1-C subfamily serine protease